MMTIYTLNKFGASTLLFPCVLFIVVSILKEVNL